MQKKSLFEDVSVQLNCSYISDLSAEPYRSWAKKMLMWYDMRDCSLYELADMAHYLYGKKVIFQNQKEAENYFEENGKTEFYS